MSTIVDISAICPQLIEGTYEQISALATGGELKPTNKYKITDYQTIYNQAGTGTVKIGATEPILLTPISPTEFAPEVVSTVNPKDIVRYDITDNETTVTNAPTKGRIIYREDENGNSAGYDWRAVLNYDGANEFLTFEGSTFALNNISGYKIEGAFIGQEFPNVIFKGFTARNEDNYFLNSVFEDDFIKNSNCEISDSTFTVEVEENRDCRLSNVTADIFVGNNDCKITASTLVRECSFNQNLVLNSNTGDIEVFACSNFALDNCTITNVGRFLKLKGQGFTGGLVRCDIDGDGNDFRFNVFEKDIADRRVATGNPITFADYPELFASIPCQIFTKPNGETWYKFKDNSNVTQFRQIL